MFFFLYSNGNLATPRDASIFVVTLYLLVIKVNLNSNPFGYLAAYVHCLQYYLSLPSVLSSAITATEILLKSSHFSL
jgi:hypothetical protein